MRLTARPRIQPRPLARKKNRVSSAHYWRNLDLSERATSSQGARRITRSLYLGASLPYFGILTAILAVTLDSSRMAFSASAWRSSNEHP